MIISKKKFQKLVDEKVWEILCEREKEDDLNMRFRRIEEQLKKIADTVYTRNAVSNIPTHD